MIRKNNVSLQISKILCREVLVENLLGQFVFAQCSFNLKMLLSRFAYRHRPQIDALTVLAFLKHRLRGRRKSERGKAFLIAKRNNFPPSRNLIKYLKRILATEGGYIAAKQLSYRFQLR